MGWNETDKAVSLWHYKPIERETMKAKYPFKETPILYGEDAIRFEKEMERVDNMSQEERRKNWEEVCRIHEEFIRKYNCHL